MVTMHNNVENRTKKALIGVTVDIVMAELQAVLLQRQ